MTVSSVTWRAIERLTFLGWLTKCWAKREKLKYCLLCSPMVLWPFKDIKDVLAKGISVWSVDSFTCFCWKFQLQKVLGIGILFSEITSCCWLCENASWIFFLFLSVYLPLPVLRDFELVFSQRNCSFSLRLSSNFWGDKAICFRTEIHRNIVCMPLIIKQI